MLFLHPQNYYTMNIEFSNPGLEELYTIGTTEEKTYHKLSKDIVKRYIKVVNYLKAAKRIEDLYPIKSLHYEKKKEIFKEWMRFGSMTSIGCCFTVRLTNRTLS